MMRLLAAWTLLLLCGCPNAPSSEPDAGDTEPLKSCLDEPTALPRPPTAGLPCELLPPTFGADRVRVQLGAK